MTHSTTTPKGAAVGYSDMSSTTRTTFRWINFSAAALLAAAMAGCGGGGGGGGTTDTAVVTPPPPAATGPTVAAPTGTAPVTVTALTADQFAALTPAITVGGVAINSPPTVTFAISDGPTTNNPVIGIGLTNQTATATLPSQAFLRFSLAKLVPGTNGSPSKWVSYIVTNPPTYKSSTDKTIVPATPRGPIYDREGTLVDNKNGTYTYTFYRDIAKMKDTVAALAGPAGSNVADLGDLTYDPALPHRLTIELAGNARGTGTNTADGSNSGVAAVALANPVNAIYDFIPATGKAIAAADLTREVVAIASCNECHEKLAMHGAGKIDTRYCVVCHTDQLKYGQTNVASTALAFPALKETATVNATTGITSYTYSPFTKVADGEVLGNFPVLVHKIHQGKDLVKQNYNFTNVAFNDKGFSMLGGGQRMCSKCHDNTKAVNADNWNTKPSRLACGACHDGINFATGTGTTLAGLTTGHVGKAQSSDATCALCHSAADIKVYHRTENITKHNPTIADGLATFTYEIKSAAVNATTNDLTIVFKISKDGTALTTVAPTGFTGGPSFLLAWAVAQDGITAPADFNNTTNAKGDATSIAIASGTGNLLSAGGIAGPDSSGYFTATIPSARGFPAGAKMRTVAMNAYYTQTSAPASTTAPVGRHAISVVKTVTGDTERRKVIDPAKCSNCHEWLELHGGSRVLAPETAGNVNVCVTCHVPAKATSGRGIADAVVNTYASTGPKFSTSDLKILAEWGLPTTFPVVVGSNWALGLPVAPNNFKDMIHGLHSGRDRVNPFRDARDRTGGTPAGATGAITLLDFRRMDFPGKRQNCLTCHAAGTYASVPAGALASTYESVNTAGNTTTALAKAALSQPNTTDIVTSPFAAACSSCHDSVAALSHMSTQGGLIQGTRAAFQTKVTTPGAGEACATCHGVGKAEDVTVKHK